MESSSRVLLHYIGTPALSVEYDIQVPYHTVHSSGYVLPNQ